MAALLYRRAPRISQTAESHLTGSRLDRFNHICQWIVDLRGKRRMEDKHSTAGYCTVVDEVNGIFWLDFVSQTRPEQDLHAVSPLLFSLAKGLVSPGNKRAGIVIAFPGD